MPAIPTSSSRCSRSGEIRARWRIATDPRRTADEYAVWLRQLLAIEGYRSERRRRHDRRHRRPARAPQSRSAGEKYFGVEPLFAGAGRGRLALEIDVEEPRIVGADRAVNAIAAHAKHPGDLIVVDFGTATTFDVVDFNGAYKGGIIAPGINLSLDALVNAAAKLPRIAIEAPTDIA